ncbi:hypothetical protein [Streptomyces sp. ECR3.8]|uniref:hypothetical protein n=1 Tax=Streptomyces sp. ECR3.8 TaxID=3461009 RepID=UPI0040415CA5
MQKRAWGKAECLRQSMHLVAVEGWPVLVYEGLGLRLADAYGGGQLADASRFPVVVVVE